MGKYFFKGGIEMSRNEAKLSQLKSKTEGLPSGYHKTEYGKGPSIH
jgi:hypothetical protein